MSDTLDFHFEFSSPYGYFASTQVQALADEFGLELRWHPVLLGPMFKAMGSAPLTEIPLKGDYARLDFDRTARLFGIPYVQPATFPIATVAAARAVLYVRESARHQLPNVVGRLYRAYFAEGRNISEREVVLDVLQEAGLDRQAVAQAIDSDPVKAALKAEVDEALKRGVFGSPFILIGNEPFWGFDRFEHIRRWLRTEGGGRTPA